jgi:hypothetical protein
MGRHRLVEAEHRGCTLSWKHLIRIWQCRRAPASCPCWGWWLEALLSECKSRDRPIVGIVIVGPIKLTIIKFFFLHLRWKFSEYVTTVVIDSYTLPYCMFCQPILSKYIFVEKISCIWIALPTNDIK